MKPGAGPAGIIVELPGSHSMSVRVGHDQQEPYERPSTTTGTPGQRRGWPMTLGKPDRRPSRLALSNWPVRWKVLAIVLVPLVLAGVFGGMRIYSSTTETVQLRRAAERADMLPTIVDYVGALEDTMLAATEGRDTRAALTTFDSRKATLQQQLADTEVPDSVEKATNTLLDYGQDLLGKVTGNSVDLRAQVMSYAPLLITAETAIADLATVDTSTVANEDQAVASEGDALSHAVGARGQMVMQQMLVTGGGELPEPVLRSSMVTLAGTEPATVSAMGAFLGGMTDQATALRTEMVKRMLVLSDPESVLVGNPELLASQQITRDIANDVIAETTKSIPATVERQADAARTAAIRDAALVATAIAIGLLVVMFMARSLVLPLRTLRDSALKVARDDLPGEVERARSEGKAVAVQPIPVHTSEEIGQVARAVDQLHKQAVQLAGEQARLQSQMTDMFDTLSRRNRSLIDQQLSLIDRLERGEADPDRLESLFRLDHLAAQMRRNGANLLVLAGGRVPREHADPMSVTELVDAAAAEVEDYARIATDGLPDSVVSGGVAGDLVHLLAELMDNALRYSPPTSQVTVSAVHTGTGGLVLEVADTGGGMAESDLRVANSRLQAGGEVNPYTARHMGLLVVGRLAAQHALVVRLRSTVADKPESGTTAGVYVPARQVVATDVPAHAEAPRDAPGEVSRAPAPPPEGPPAHSGVAAFPDPAARDADSDEVIYERMLSESLADPHELSHSTDLNWRTVWEHGWSADEAADGAPVRRPGQ